MKFRKEEFVEDNKPVHSIHYGLIKASIWRNETAKGVFHNVTFCRLFKDEDNWSQTAVFGGQDLPVLFKVVLDVHTWIYSQREQQEGTVNFPVLVGNGKPINPPSEPN